jgi:hypothetical protein
VKALDGAGNASAETYVTTMHLDPGCEVIAIRLPIILVNEACRNSLPAIVPSLPFVRACASGERT